MVGERLKSKGQVTIFVILGIVLLIGAGFIFFILNKSADDFKEKEIFDAQSGKADAGQVRFFIQSCIEKSSEEALQDIASRGGFTEQNEDSDFGYVYDYDYEEYFYTGLPLYIKDKTKKNPELYEIEIQLSKSVEKLFSECTNNLSTFNSTGLKFEFGAEFSAKSKINQKDISINLNYPLTIINGKDKTEIEKFNYNMNYNFYEKYELVEEFLDQQMQDLEYIDTGSLAYLAHKNGFEFEITELEYTNAVMFNFIFKDYKIYSDDALQYTFIIEYY